MVIGKIPQGIINTELDQNVAIMNEILPLYQKEYKPHKNAFNLSLVEDD